jgi:UDP-4-amino-4,6-dideoxy-N-acetyl-beta-L-altrosamine transaminase|tara:strand:- start:5232 stop:6410 length:1179 start_codon:yes stop_codon:yes gene_type:complete
MKSKQKIIQYGGHKIFKEDIDSVIKVLKSSFLTTGPKVDTFEKKISNYVGSKFSVAVNSATSALHVACKALELDKGDYLWTSPNSFVASANCALYCGAGVDFVDIELKNYNIDLKKLKEKLIYAKKINKLPKIIVPVSYSGHSIEMKKLKALSNIYKFKIIEDASHSLGATYLGKKVGGCQYSDITVFSFHPVKMITTGEGGIATTNNKSLSEKMKVFRSHGIIREKKLFKNKNKNITHYEQQELGFNYRLNDIQASLGISQLKKINLFLRERRKIKKYYDKYLKLYPLILPYENKYAKSSWHLYPVLIDNKKSNKNKNEFLEYLRKHNILLNTHYIPIHTHPYYEKIGFKKTDFKNSVFFYNNAISLPIYVGLNIKDLKYIISIIFKFFKK